MSETFDFDILRTAYGPITVPPCSECGATLGQIAGSPTQPAVYGCHVDDDHHYPASIWVAPTIPDPRVLALVDAYADVLGSTPIVSPLGLPTSGQEGESFDQPPTDGHLRALTQAGDLTTRWLATHLLGERRI